MSANNNSLQQLYVLAQRRAECRELLRSQFLNMPAAPQERVAADARCRLFQEEFDKVDREYQEALSNLSTEALRELVKGVSGPSPYTEKGELHSLSLWERLLLWLGKTNATALESKRSPPLST